MPTNYMNYGQLIGWLAFDGGSNGHVAVGFFPITSQANSQKKLIRAGLLRTQGHKAATYDVRLIFLAQTIQLVHSSTNTQNTNLTPFVYRLAPHSHASSLSSHRINHKAFFLLTLAFNLRSPNLLRRIIYAYRRTQ